MISSFLSSMVMYCIVCLPMYLVVRYFYMKNKETSWQRETLMLLFFLYCVSIFSQTIIPNFYVIDGRLIFNTSTAYSRSNFTPLKTIMLYYDQLNGPLASIAFYNLAGNVVLFIPFGFFIPLLWPTFNGWVKMHSVAFFIPLFIECTQYFIGRSIDVDDVLLNAIAIVIGFILYKMLQRMRNFKQNK